VLEVNKRLGELFFTGETTCNSPFLRYLIYNQLERRGIPFNGKVMGHGGGVYGDKGSLYWQPSPKLAYTFLKKGMYWPDTFKDATWVNKERTGCDEATRLKLFDRRVSDDEKFEILTKIYDTQEDRCERRPILGRVCKTIKTIRVHCAWPTRRLLYIAHADVEHCGETFARLPPELLVLIDHYILRGPPDQ
jgi:hypothetical protein